MVTVDFSNTYPFKNHTKRRKGARRDKDKFWDQRFLIFKNAGFTATEARWAANHGLSLEAKQVQDVLTHRSGVVEYYINKGYSKTKAIRLASELLQDKLGPKGKMNLFVELSP